MRKKIALALSFVMLMASNTFASSRNWVNKVTTIRKNQAVSDQYLKIVPYDGVATGSSIIVTVTNAKVMDQATIDASYQYDKVSWSGQSFWTTMPKIKTNELPYRIYKRGSHEMEIWLINVPERYADSSLYGVNGSTQTAAYVIPLPIIGDTGGDIKITIDNNGSTISSCTLSAGYVYDKKVYLAEKKGITTTVASDSVNVDEITESTTEEVTETTTQAVSQNTGASQTTDKDENKAEETIVDISDNELISVRGVSKILKKDDEYSNLIWDAETKTVTIVYKGRIVKFTSGANYVEVDGETIDLDDEQTAEIVNDRMYVPLGVLCRSLDIKLTTSFFAPGVLDTEKDETVTEASTEGTTEEATEEATEETTEATTEAATEETTEATTEAATESGEADDEETDKETDEEQSETTTENNLINSDDIIVRGKSVVIPSNV